METIHMSRVLPPGSGVAGISHAQDAHCPLSELKECQRLFERWKSEVDKARCHGKRVELEGILAAVSVLQEATDGVVVLAEETVEHHREFCDRMANTLRLAAHRSNGELFRDEKVVTAGEDVSRSFANFSSHIDQLQDALQNLATSLTALSLTDDAQPEAHTHHHHLIPHPHLLSHLQQFGKSMTNREVIAAILGTSIKIMFAVMAILVAVHPAVHLVLAFIVPHEDDVEKWVEKAVHAVSEFFDHWKHHASHGTGSQHQVDVADTLALIRDKLPAQIGAIKRELEESGVKMERAALEVQYELREHSVRIERNDAEAAARVWEGLHASLAPNTGHKERVGPHWPHWPRLVGHGHSDVHSH